MVRRLRDVKEIRLIKRLARGLKAKDKKVVVSIGDDAAVVKSSGNKYVLYTCDMLVESVHFRRKEDLRKVGYKALAVSVSDIAAMGGVPKYALVSVGIPKAGAERISEGLFEGIRECAKEFNVDVIGGDTNRAKDLVIDIFVVGEVEPQKMVRRSTAKPGDFIFVSGPLGGSLKGRHLSFTPRVKESRYLVDHFKVTSMIDLSDGLAMDLNRIAEASRIGALIFESKIPKTKGSLIKAALFDGEDFELLFTLSGDDALKLYHLMRRKKTLFKFTSIGKITDLFCGVKMVTNQGRIRDVGCEGFKHF
jgi:thiamine-monophosphate kinase